EPGTGRIGVRLPGFLAVRCHPGTLICSAASLVLRADTTPHDVHPRRAASAFPGRPGPVIMRPGEHGVSRFSDIEIPSMHRFSPPTRGPRTARASAARDVAFHVYNHVGTPIDKIFAAQ